MADLDPPQLPPIAGAPLSLVLLPGGTAEVAAEVVESLEAALASFRSVAAKLQGL